MSIYTMEQLIELVQKMDRAEMEKALTKILRIPVSATMRSHMAKAIVKTANTLDETVLVGQDRGVPLRQIMNLVDSPIMDFVSEIIEVAMQAPYSTHDLLMAVASQRKGKTFYITSGGIPQAVKVQAGLILTMAGFERVSHYDKERDYPVKAWKSKYGYSALTLEMRLVEVEATIKELTEGNVTFKAKAPTPPPSFSPKDFL